MGGCKSGRGTVEKLEIDGLPVENLSLPVQARRQIVGILTWL